MQYVFVTLGKLRDYNVRPLDITETIDERTLRMSKVAGVDLRPLIHVWGLHPKDIGELFPLSLFGCILPCFGFNLIPVICVLSITTAASKIQMEASNLFPSQALKEELQRYATLIPPNQAALIQHFERVWPGKKDVPLCYVDSSGPCCEDERYGCGWYNENYPLWNEALALETESALNDIITTYWGSEVSCSTSS
jgi:hypothetical protein